MNAEPIVQLACPDCGRPLHLMEKPDNTVSAFCSLCDELYPTTYNAEGATTDD
jgi:hypothetical protein